ncbi:hypothetical protein GPJ56_007508 [Histomonas meleagridis]|uniref:uncharacterized protein n=1 Tax=Histomonas meleagridis TaxID=135588 RepID=UPI00355A52E3|nr:hypothetical protein GPJ56_007508 [Histomonas meleagridis]KAH0804354.1 hypothetical protein GO595_003184 [Histomonas meleagridis]
MSEEAGPLAALLAQHPQQQETVLDVHFKNSIAPKIEMQSHEKTRSIPSNPPTQKKKDESNSESDEDKPIGLTYRQLSFTSIDGNLVSKGGEPLGISIPSKVVPTKEEEIDNEIDEEDKNDPPQVQIVKELRTKNLKRWKEMGYEPPADLIKLTRAHTQDSINEESFKPFDQEIPHPNSSREASADHKNRHSISHKRCGSDGMKLGEASSSLSRMSEALMLPPSRKQVNKVENEINSEEDTGELFGNLGKIVRHSDKVVYEAIRTGDLSNVKDAKRLYKAFKKLQDKCISELWADEASYLAELMEGLNIDHSDKLRPSNDEIKQLQRKSQESSAKYDQLITKELDKEKLTIELLKKQYEFDMLELESMERASKHINKISQQNILSLEEEAKNLMRRNQMDSARKVIDQIDKLKNLDYKSEKIANKKRALHYELQLKIDNAHAKCEINVADLKNRQSNSQKKYSSQINRIKKYKVEIRPEIRYTATKKDLLKISAPKMIDRKNEKITDFNSS